MISIRSLHKYFNKNKQNEIHVINDISLDLPEQGMVALFGRSGCGKTTLLNAIGGLDKTQSGSILIDGKDARKKPDVIRNQYIGYIFQNYNLNNQQSCFENVANALYLCGITDKALIEERVMAALACVGMDKYKSRTPDTLSGGQMQRIAIARAIVKNPKIILADEPTGNLDEANTIQVMDLLKKIAENHLVILVTHEANLVDYYCDKVIELSDGKILSTRDNYGANGFAARSKNDIYLGEYEKAETNAGGVNVEYYGQTPSAPVRLRIVNHGGKIYLSVDSESVQILDSGSEVKLREGVYTEVARTEENKANIDMSKLPPITGSHFGRLFNFRSSFKSGYNANFKKNKKSTKALRACMFLFSLVLIFMSASFGTAFKTIDDVKLQYNQNMFYVYTNSADISNKLNEAVGQHGIDNIQLYPGVPYGNGSFIVSPGRFESFATDEASFKAYADVLDIKFAGAPTVIAGKADNLSDSEVVITSVLADRLIEASTVGYVKSYADLLGLYAKINAYNVNQNGVRIVGVIQSEESAVYRSSVKSANDVLNSMGINIKINKYSTLTLNSGETYLILSDEGNTVGFPNKDETVKINGKDFKVKDVISYYHNYDEYLFSIGSPLVKLNNPDKPEQQYIERIGFDEYFRSLVQAEFYPEHPNIQNYQNWEYTNKLDEYAKNYVKDNFFSEHPNINEYQWSNNPEEKAIYIEFITKVAEYKKNENIIQAVKADYLSQYPYDTNVDNHQLYCEYQARVEEYISEHLVEYYEEIYKHLDGYVKHNHIIRPDINSWIYIEKGFEELKFNNIWDTDYFYILMFKEKNGRYPTYQEFYYTDRNELANEFKHDFNELHSQYSNEFYQANPDAYSYRNSYLLCEADYVSLSTMLGETHESLLNSDGSFGGIIGGGIIIGGGKYESSDIAVNSGLPYYTAIHSTDHAATEAFLKQFEGTQVADPEYQKAIYTPDGMFEDFMSDFKADVVSKIIVLTVFLAIMSLCMYFIMRSSLMARIKEIGIYRAIGVSKKNLTFRFFVEALVLTTFTVFIGYVISSGILFGLSASVSLLDSILYYPVWLAGVILAVLYAVCLICGLIPIFNLLRKTPSEILSKYDI